MRFNSRCLCLSVYHSLAGSTILVDVGCELPFCSHVNAGIRPLQETFGALGYHDNALCIKFVLDTAPISVSV